MGLRLPGCNDTWTFKHMYNNYIKVREVLKIGSVTFMFLVYIGWMFKVLQKKCRHITTPVYTETGPVGQGDNTSYVRGRQSDMQVLIILPLNFFQELIL